MEIADLQQRILARESEGEATSRLGKLLGDEYGARASSTYAALIKQSLAGVRRAEAIEVRQFPVPLSAPSPPLPHSLSGSVVVWLHLSSQGAGLGDDQMDEAAFITTAYRYDIALGPHDYDKCT